MIQGLVYCIIAPLISVFCIITFSLFWMVYRYQTLYVNRYTVDTGGLLFPKAINQLFTGIYVMEFALAALFFVQRDQDGNPNCTRQGIIMVVAFICSMLYQWLFNDAFAPLHQYIPITMEDEAVLRDEEFARAQNKRFGIVNEEEGENIQDVLKRREKEERQADKQAEEIEMNVIEANRQREHQPDGSNMVDATQIPAASGWAKRDPSSDSRTKNKDGTATTGADAGRVLSRSRSMQSGRSPPRPANLNPITDVEAQKVAHNANDYLFEGFHDEIEDLSPDERDELVRRAFQHSAVRANRPSIWLPRDPYGLSDDEIKHTQQLAGENIWITNMYSRLDKRGRVRYSRPPPDFDSRELMQL
jgi:calcium permeable stress-gated cation channel